MNLNSILEKKIHMMIQTILSWQNLNQLISKYFSFLVKFHFFKSLKSIEIIVRNRLVGKVSIQLESFSWKRLSSNWINSMGKIYNKKF